jgi:hypothetical protein
VVTEIQVLRALATLIVAIMLNACSSSVAGSVNDLDFDTAAEPGAWTFLFALPDASGTRLAILGFDETHHLRVAFASGGGLRQLSQRGIQVSDIAWMPDERLLVAFGDPETSTNLALMDPSNGSIVQRLDVDWQQVVDFHSMDVSPDGTRAIIAAREPGLTGSPSDLYLVDLETGRTQSVTNTIGTHELSPTFVDADTIAYVEGESTLGAGVPNGTVRTLDLVAGQSSVVSGPSFVARSVAAGEGSGEIIYDGFELGDRGSQGVWLVTRGVEEPMSLVEGPYSFPASLRTERFSW